MFTALAGADTGDATLGRLIERARAGDRAAFGRLLEAHLGAARRLALAAVGHLADADEAVQEASIAAWQRLDGLNDPAAFRAWFLRIVWRKALDHRRAVRLRWWRFGGAAEDADTPLEVRDAGHPQPDAQLMSEELRAAIASVIRGLPRRLRDPLLLAASGDHRYEEIAALLGVPVGTVKWRVSEARRLAAEKLRRLGHGVGGK
jgi:RNA polymerase sigma-70 factor (ECF subfamily)